MLAMTDLGTLRGKRCASFENEAWCGRRWRGEIGLVWAFVRQCQALPIVGAPTATGLLHSKALIARRVSVVKTL